MIVQTSWKFPDGKPVSNAVIWSDGEENADLEDEVMVENCVLLEAPDKGEGPYPTVPACQLLLSCQPPYQISRISVLCEARVMEVYGHHGEYLKTIKNELLEEADDIIVFKGDIVLERPLGLCSIKFAGLRTSSEMWLYGVKILRTKQDFDQENMITIPLAAVEQRLAQMGLTLSDKAEAFKQLVEKCQKSPMVGQLDIGFLIATLQQSNLVKNKTPPPENVQHFAESLESLMKGVDNRDNHNNLKDYLKVGTPLSKDSNQNSPLPPYYVMSSATSPMIHESCTSSTQTDEEYSSLEERIKAHINEQMLELDKKLWDRINQKFQETEAKLMCKLDEIESFVKPHGIASS